MVAPVELQVGLIRFDGRDEVRHVCTQAVGQFEAVGDVPFVLQEEAGLDEGYFRSRILIAVIAVGQTESNGRITSLEVVKRGILIVARTIAHVGVDGLLILHVQTADETVRTDGPGEMVLQVEDVILRSGGPGKELVTGRHKGVARAVPNVDEGEGLGGGVTLVVDVGVGEEDAVLERVAETAVKLAGDGPDVVLHPVAGVAEREGLVRDAARRGAWVDARRPVGLIDVRVRGVVEAHAQLVGVVDVPVQTG